MDRGKPLSQRLDMRCGQPLRLCHGAEQVSLAEAVHLHRILQRFASASYPDIPLTRARHDRYQAEVERRRHPAIQFQFGFAIRFARSQRGEVDKIQAHRLAHFVGEGAGQEHLRDVRLDEADFAHGMWVGRGAHQRLREYRRFHAGLSRCLPPRSGRSYAHAMHVAGIWIDADQVGRQPPAYIEA